MKNRFFFALIILILFSTYISKDNLLLKLNFEVKEIIVENNYIMREDEIKNELSFLYNSNLLFLKNKDIIKNLKDKSFIESFEIRRIFPNKVKIKIYEKKPVAILQNKMKKYYFTNKGGVVDYQDLNQFQNLPIVFGDSKNFKKFFTSLKKINFPINSIKMVYYFESRRWDLITKQNKTIKLPIKNYNKSLINFLSIKDKDNFAKYKIFDYRINNQLILK
tara:strand:+ start:213 stop:872 length:660 start_codon:yes stop_codon:yes gene_type:complete